MTDKREHDILVDTEVPPSLDFPGNSPHAQPVEPQPHYQPPLVSQQPLGETGVPQGGYPQPTPYPNTAQPPQYTPQAVNKGQVGYPPQQGGYTPQQGYPPQPGYGYPQPPVYGPNITQQSTVIALGGANTVETIVKPPSYVVLAILSCFFCFWPTGIVAMIHAFKVDSAFFQGDYSGARHYSEMARRWSYTSIIVGVCLTIVIIFIYVFLFAMASG